MGSRWRLIEETVLSTNFIPNYRLSSPRSSDYNRRCDERSQRIKEAFQLPFNRTDLQVSISAIEIRSRSGNVRRKCRTFIAKTDLAVVSGV